MQRGRGLIWQKWVLLEKPPKVGAGIQRSQKESLTTFETKPSIQPEKPKGFFWKILNKAKSFAKSKFTLIKEKFALFRIKEKRRPAFFMSTKADDIFCNPVIAHQMVYQSVEAPQIEVLSKQELQPNPNNPIFKSYDLIRGKSAGVVVKIEYPQNCTLDDENFTLGLDIDGMSVEAKCLSFIQTAQGGGMKFLDSVPNQDGCIFSIQDFSKTDTLLKFIELPVDALDRDRKGMPLKVQLFDENDFSISKTDYVSVNNRNLEKLSHCGRVINLNASNEFCLDMHTTKSVSLGVISITGACKGWDLSTAQTAMVDLLKSDEVQSYLPVIFPIPEPQTIEDIIEPLKLKHIRRYEIPIERKPLFHINKGRLPEDEWLSSPSCDNTPYTIQNNTPYYSLGIGEMIQSFNGLLIRNKKEKDRKNRMMIMISRSFMDYHHVPFDTVGFVWSYKGRSSYRRILFMNENYQDTGTLLHEIAHGIGQLKEFYEIFDRNQQPVLCQRFNGSLEFPCKDQYFIQRGLRARKGRLFNWVSGNFESIMHSATHISKKWIDRETYQKAFRFLKTSSSRSEVQEKFKRHPKLIVSGFYNKDSNELTGLEREGLSPDIEEITSPLTDGLSGEGRLDYIKIQLEKEGDPVYEVRHPADMFAEIYRVDGEYETISLPTSFIHAVIPIIGEGDFKIRFFKGTFWFNQEGEVIERARENQLSQDMSFTWPEK